MDKPWCFLSWEILYYLCNTLIKNHALQFFDFDGILYLFISWNPPSNTSNCASGEGGIRIYFTRSDIQSGISKRTADPIENSIDIPFDTSTSEHTLTLEPYSQYLIQVVVYNKDSETPRGEGFTQITEEMRKRKNSIIVLIVIKWECLYVK